MSMVNYKPSAFHGHKDTKRRYGASKILGSRVWPFGVTWRHRSRRYKASKLHLPMLKAKSSLRMLRVTWTVGRGSKSTTYLEFPRPYCLFTIQLLWAYD